MQVYKQFINTFINTSISVTQQIENLSTLRITTRKCRRENHPGFKSHHIKFKMGVISGPKMENDAIKKYLFCEKDCVFYE